MKTNNSIVPLIEESNRVLAEAIKHFGLKIPADKITLTIQSKGRKNALGWFWAERWAKNKDVSHEINLSAEHLKEHNMGETLIHELAHAENHFNGVQDCDKTGRRHNKKFKAQAEALGLEVEKSGSLGWAFTKLTPVSEKFLADIKFDLDLFKLFRAGAESKEGKAGTRMLKCQCPKCGYVVRTTAKWLAVGVPTCPCGEEMEGPDEA
jgi:hypothetical protein